MKTVWFGQAVCQTLASCVVCHHMCCPQHYTRYWAPFLLINVYDKLQTSLLTISCATLKDYLDSDLWFTSPLEQARDPYNITFYIFKLFHCINTVLRSDEASEVRQAAVLVLTLVLKGLGQSTVVVSIWLSFSNTR